MQWDKPLAIDSTSYHSNENYYCPSVAGEQKHPIFIDLKPSRSFSHFRKTYMYGDQLLLKPFIELWWIVV